jgi:hypothetical protein
VSEGTEKRPGCTSRLGKGRSEPCRFYPNRDRKLRKRLKEAGELKCLIYSLKTGLSKRVD